MRLLLLLLAGLLIPHETVEAQGFRLYSDRNHPEITWLTADTDHFRIVYPEHLEGIEGAAAAIAEESYEMLSANLDVKFDRPIRIYLTDEDEIANGFAVPIGNGFTNIWVHVNDVAEAWTGREKWLRKVIAHELAHIFHFRAVQSNIGMWQNVVANPLPSFWTEGLAQYLTEEWDALRGDIWLRTAVLDDRLSYSDGRSAWNGRLRYAVGNSQVRFFAEQYGDSTLASMLRHRRSRLFGLAKVHDFEAAFRSAAGKSYREFYDDWRRHINIYYNSMAGSLENPDSLGVDPENVPGQYVYDVSYSPDTSHAAVLSLTSLERPIRRLYHVNAAGHVRMLAEGSLRGPVSWSPDGHQVALTRMMRGPNGTLLNDIVVVDVASLRERRITRGRRTASPVFNPRSGSLTFITTDRGTSNVYELNPVDNVETALTSYEGDIQIGSITWDRDGERLAISIFDSEGNRDIHVYHAHDGRIETLISSPYDDRDPVWSQDGRQLAFTSIRGDVPNVYVLDLETDSVRSITALATGARVRDWLPPSDDFPAGRLVTVSGISKSQDRVFVIDASRDAGRFNPVVPEAYATWTAHRPPQELASSIEPDFSLIKSRGRYNSWRNITHAASLALPYYAGPSSWGLFGLTSFVEPLGKHSLAGFGIWSIADPENYWFAASYINNQWHPTISATAYRIPATFQVYGDEILAERHSGGEVVLRLPLSWMQRPYTSTDFRFRTRLISFEPLHLDDVGSPDDIDAPISGEQFDVQIEWIRRTLRPYRYNVIHPLDGNGVLLRVTAAAPVLGTDMEYLEGDVRGFAVLPAPARHQFYIYGRAQARLGTSRPQDYIGLSRYDDVLLSMPDLLMLEIGGRERVRGYNEHLIGDRLLFGSAEYRIPLLPDLQTRVLGLVSFGATSLAFFADGAAVRTPAADDWEYRLGAGVELKNALRLAGLEIAHSVGAAQPHDALGRNEPVDVYYRIRAAIPF